MAGYLDAYGAGDEQKERRIKRVVLGALIVAIAATSVYFTFRNWRQEQMVKQFFGLLREKKYQDAYKLWGPSKYYSPEKFIEDWGPSSPFADPSAAKIIHEDSCGTGVVFNIEVPNAEGIGIYVERGTELISFAPWPRCPGPHLQLWEFLKSHFG